jgi:hypothetical protein
MEQSESPYQARFRLHTWFHEGTPVIRAVENKKKKRESSDTQNVTDTL